ncbi:hypothetical protein GCM10027053_51530 [Intrasporangium mesophilum]
MSRATIIVETGRRPDIERELSERYAVEWEFRPAVPIASFDQDKSLHNQARFEALDEKTVELYTEAVKRGDEFPAVIAYRPSPRARLVMIDGNHRLSAHIRAEKPVDVYEVDRDTDRRAIALMTYSFNTRHGRPTSETERLSQAAYLVDNGSSIAHAAAAVSIPVAHLKRHLTRVSADTRADEVGLKRNEWDALNATVRSRLSQIYTDEGFADAAKLAFAARLDADEVFELVALLNSTKSGARQRAIVTKHREMMRERIQAAAGGALGTAPRKAQGPKQRLSMALGQALALPEDDQAIVGAYAQSERKDAARHIREVVERLTRLAVALDAAK